jgi:hypothetical protein
MKKKANGIIAAMALLMMAPHDLPAQQKQAVHRIILIGDAGELKNGRNEVIDAVKNNFQPDGATTILYLGDNIYPVGMPDGMASSYNNSKKIIDYQVSLAKNTAAKTFFIPGNHDWAQGRPFGFQQIKRQQQYIDSLYLDNIKMVPSGGCPGPVEIPINENILLVVMDTQWFLQGFEKPGIESDCPCKTGDEVIAKLEDIAENNKNKILLFATHHPFRTHGPHGGYYTFKQHIFPLTELSKGLYIPLPVIGSIYPVTRGVFGNIQDNRHPIYKKMVRAVEAALQQHPQVIMVAGHEHSLQWIKENKTHYIVSGSGAKTSRVKQGSNSLFTSPQNGFAALELYDGGQVQLKFFSVSNSKTTLLLDTALLTLQKTTDSIATAGPRNFPDSVSTAAGKYYDDASGLKRFLMGRNYRKEWATTMGFPVFDIAKEKGGLKILQRGGGHQTKSLRMEDADGKQWVLRTIEKYPEAAIPPPLRQTFAARIVKDQISSAHPYGPLVVPVLADAAGVAHSNPKFVFVPDDPMLGKYRKDFANTLCLFEEREPVEKDKTYNTAKVLEELQSDNDNRVNQKVVLEARLLDIFIGDWDRHDDQWRWINEKDEKKGSDKKFAPLPRDRDQAFFINTGFIPGIAKFPWILPSIQGFKPHLSNIKGFNFGARYFDRSFLNELNKEEWKTAADLFVQKMTDNVIDKSVQQLPSSVSASGKKISATLKGRRKYMMNEMLDYYRFLAKTVSIPGSDKRERFALKGLNDGTLELTVQKISKSGEYENPFYRRIFDASDTKEIRLYALKGDDELLVEGKIPSIKIRWIGGEGEDKLVAGGNADLSGRVHVYDLSTEKNDYATTGAKLNLSPLPAVNEYNRNDFVYNRTIPMITPGFNPDDGFIIGIGVKHIGHGFRKKPQAVIHEFNGTYAFSTSAFSFGYSGTFTDVFRRTDLIARTSIKAPNNTINFFGFGNESVYLKTGKRSFVNYRTRFTSTKTELLLKYKFTPGFSLSIGPSHEYYNMSAENNKGKLISIAPFQGLDSASIFNSKSYGTLQGYLEIDTRKDPLMPARGIHWLTSMQASAGLNDNSSNFAKLHSELSVYISFNIPARVIISNRTGGGTIWGKFEFFQAHTLGNSLNMRGHRNFRFAGRSSFYNNTELRLKLFDFDSYLLPGSLGLIGFFDVGRVWYDNENSKTLHTAYGGGIYLSPINRLILTLTYGVSKEDRIPNFGVGFRF